MKDILCPYHEIKRQMPLDGAKAYDGGMFANTQDVRPRPDISNVDPSVMGDVMKQPTGRK